MQRCRWLGMVGALVALVVLSPVLAGASPAPQKGLRPLGLITFTPDASTLAAQRQGFFAAEGLDVGLTITPNSTTEYQGLAEGQWAIGGGGFDNVLAWSGHAGSELVGISQTDNGILLQLFAQPGTTSIEDLRGKRLAVDAVDTAFALVLRKMLLDHGLDFTHGDYELIPVGQTSLRLESLIRGDTFAGLLNPPWDENAQAAGLAFLGDHRDAVPDYAGGVFATNEVWARAHRADVVGFLRAWLAGDRWVQANHEAAIAMLQAEQNISRAAAEGRLAGISPDGVLNVPGLQTTLDLRTEFGYTLPMGTDLSRYLDDSYWREAAGR
ncbi:MAG TPA: ABC transporter substrate-binding protein [Chloroflexota bacterium]